MSRPSNNLLLTLTLLCAAPALSQERPDATAPSGVVCRSTDDDAFSAAHCAVSISLTPVITLPKVSAVYDTNGLDTVLPNPNTGYYQFSPKHKLPAPLVASDVYFRFPWKLIEPEKDVYNFSALEQALGALKKGQRLAFRIMPLNTCCSKDAPLANDVPDYFTEGDKPETNPVGAHGWYHNYSTLYTRTKMFVPDWNDEFYLSRVEKLLQRLAKKYDGDPRINWVEIGTYGNWGEWHTYPLTYPDQPDYAKTAANPREYLIAPPDTGAHQFRTGTPETRARLLRAYTSAFKQTRLIALTSGIYDALKLNTAKPIGFRRDSWGHAMHADLESYQAKRYTEDDLKLIFNRWKIAPIYAESWGYGHAKEASFTMDVVQQLAYFHTSAVAFAGFFPAEGFGALSPEDQALYIKAGNHTGYRYAVKQADVEINKGQLALRTSWINEGVAPTYDEWKVGAYLYDPDARKALTTKVALPLELSKLYNDSDYAPEIAKLVQKNKVAPIQSILHAYDGSARKAAQASTQMDVSKVDFQRAKAVELRVIVEDKGQYLPPMNLNNQATHPDGSVTILRLK